MASVCRRWYERDLSDMEFVWRRDDRPPPGGRVVIARRRLKRRGLKVDLKEDPFSLLINFVDCSLVFALGFMIALLDRPATPGRAGPVRGGGRGPARPDRRHPPRAPAPDFRHRLRRGRPPRHRLPPRERRRRLRAGCGGPLSRSSRARGFEGVRLRGVTACRHGHEFLSGRRIGREHELAGPYRTASLERGPASVRELTLRTTIQRRDRLAQAWSPGRRGPEPG